MRDGGVTYGLIEGDAVDVVSVEVTEIGRWLARLWPGDNRH